MKQQKQAPFNMEYLAALDGEQLLKVFDNIITEMVKRENSRYGQPTRQQLKEYAMTRDEILRRMMGGHDHDANP